MSLKAKRALILARASLTASAPALAQIHRHVIEAHRGYPHGYARAVVPRPRAYHGYPVIRRYGPVFGGFGNFYDDRAAWRFLGFTAWELAIARKFNTVLSPSKARPTRVSRPAPRRGTVQRVAGITFLRGSLAGQYGNTLTSAKFQLGRLPMMIRAAVFVTCVALASAAMAADTPSVKGAAVYIIAPKNGDTTGTKVTVLFGLKGMGIAPAGVEMEGTGHHHLIVDKDTPALNDYLPVGDAQVLHFGKGQTETELTLAPGRHTLQLVFGDKDHKPHVPAVVSEKVTITVK